jgi:hypothetical protein
MLQEKYEICYKKNVTKENLVETERRIMGREVIVIGLSVSFFIVCLSGCFSSSHDYFIGSWFSDEGEIADSLTFYTNGSVFHEYITILNEEWLNYTINDNKVTIGDIVYNFSFTDDHLTLMLTDVSENITRTYERQ